jgi:hypothetical protein
LNDKTLNDIALLYNLKICDYLLDMKVNIPQLLCLLFLLGLVGWGCEKQPGEGGNARIRGKILQRNYNPGCVLLLSEYLSPGEEVFLVYGDDISYSDKIDTNPEGAFEFPYLYKGKYTVYVYSEDCSGTSPSGEVVVDTIFEITENKQIYDLDTLIIINR